MKILITGGSRGIGKACVWGLQAEGHEVLFPSREDMNLLSNYETYLYARGMTKCIDVLIHNAGVYLNKNATETTPKEWDEITQVNFLSPVTLTMELLRCEKLSLTGHIIFISSLDVNLLPPKQIAYNCSKAALENFALCLTREYKELKISVLQLGVVDTDMYLPSEPVHGELLTPEDISEAVLKVITHHKGGYREYEIPNYPDYRINRRGGAK